jgi:hypothetical protein
VLVPLSETQRAVLDMERTWWQYGGTKSGTVRAHLGLSLSRYNQLLSELATNKDAEAYDPLVVARLRRSKRERRRRLAGVVSNSAKHSSSASGRQQGLGGQGRRRPQPTAGAQPAAGRRPSLRLELGAERWPNGRRSSTTGHRPTGQGAD